MSYITTHKIGIQLVIGRIYRLYKEGQIFCITLNAYPIYKLQSPHKINQWWFHTLPIHDELEYGVLYRLFTMWRWCQWLARIQRPIQRWAYWQLNSIWTPYPAEQVVGIPPLQLASHRIKLVTHTILAVHCRLTQSLNFKEHKDHTKWLASHHCGWHPTAAVGIPPHKTCNTHYSCCTL